MGENEIGREAPEMVRKVAEAIQAALAEHGDHVYAELHHTAKNLTYVEGCFDLAVVARAAVEAMREPTRAMTKAGVDFALGVSLGGDYHWPDYISDMHRVQIDAALSDARTGADQAEVEG